MECSELELARSHFLVEEWCEGGENLPLHIADWLLYSGSLTEKLQKICPNLSVEIVGEMWQSAKQDHHSNNYWVREVILKCGEREWIFAQTRLSESTIREVASDVPHLGNNPIGLWLFPQHPERVSLEWQQNMKTGLYSRRSSFLLRGYPLEIKELFLPQFPFEK